MGASGILNIVWKALPVEVLKHGLGNAECFYYEILHLINNLFATRFSKLGRDSPVHRS
jgi:hypothetical protein